MRCSGARHQSATHGEERPAAPNSPVAFSMYLRAVFSASEAAAPGAARCRRSPRTDAQSLPSNIQCGPSAPWTSRASKTGIFYPLVARGSYVEAGIKVGYVTDYFGKTIFKARAPVAGVVLHICPLPSMKKGDTIMSIGVVAKSPPM